MSIPPAPSACRAEETFPDIESVSVASYPADFVHHDPTVNLDVSDTTDFHAYPEVKRRYYSALAESAEGELAIAIPPEVSIKHVFCLLY